MATSLNKDNDEKILELVRQARKIGAYIEVTTAEVGEYINHDAMRTITIKYSTHNADARVL